MVSGGPESENPGGDAASSDGDRVFDAQALPAQTGSSPPGGAQANAGSDASEDTRLVTPKSGGMEESSKNNDELWNANTLQMPLQNSRDFETGHPDVEIADPPGAVHLGQAASHTRVRYFGDYELLSEIARGGMGVVYKARQTNLNRIVALKMILAGQLASAEEVQRFRTEAEAAANLDHPGIVPIHEIGLHEGHHYFSMGYVDGCSLADRVRNGPMQPKEAAELTRKIAEAIAFAHSRNVIHRDLKPANILLDQNHEPKVTDFGLARRMDNNSSMTRTGAVMGTPSYMSPEQAAGRTGDVGPLSDVYSLGAILYCLLSGRPPFQAANPIDTMLQVMEREPVTVSTINPAIQRDLETICHKCLQKEPSRRYASAMDLADDLGRWLRGEPITARAVSKAEKAWRWVQRNQLVSMLLGVTVCAIIAGSAFSIAFGVAAEQEATRAKQAETRAKESESYARIEATNAREAEIQAIQSQARAFDSERLAKTSEIRARDASANADSAREKAEAFLARSDYFVAISRWQDGRVVEAREFLNRIPRRHRDFEWRLANLHFQGAAVTLPDTGSCVSFNPNGTRIATGYLGHIKLLDAATGNELRTLKTESTLVNCVLFSPDGRLLVSGDNDAFVTLWDVETGDLLQAFEGHELPVTCLSFSPDGRRLVSGSASIDSRVPGEMILWDINSKSILRQFSKLNHAVHGVAFHPDGTRIVSGGGTNGLNSELTLWDAESGTECGTMSGQRGSITSISISPDGRHIAAGDDNRTIRIWDIATQKEVHTIQGHRGIIKSLSFSPDGMRLVSGTKAYGGAGEITLWDMEGQKELETFRGHPGSVNSVVFSPDGSRIASAGDDSTVKLWNVAGDNQFLRLKGHESGVTAVAFSADGRRMASGSHDSTIRLWDTTTGAESLILSGHEYGITSLSFSPDGTRIASASEDGTIRLWNAATGQHIDTRKAHDIEVVSLAFSPDGARLVSTGGRHGHEGEVRLWDTESGEQVLSFTGHNSSVTSLAFSPDGKSIASGSEDDTIILWNAVTGEELKTFSGHQNAVTCLSFSPNGLTIASGSNDRVIKIWDVASGKERLSLLGHEDAVSSISFSPGGQRLVSGSDDSTIKLWDPVTGEELLSLKEHRRRVTSVSFSPDGTCFASGGGNYNDPGELILWNTAPDDELRIIEPMQDALASPSFSSDCSQVALVRDNNTIILKDTATGQELRAFRGLEHPVTCLSLSSDGTQLASGGGDFITHGELRLWDTATGQVLRSFTGLESPVTCVALSPDGTRLAAGIGHFAEPAKIRFWDCSTGQELHSFTGHQHPVSCIAFSSDGTRLVSGEGSLGEPGTVKLWNTITGEEVRTFQWPESSANSVAIHPDGTFVASGGIEGTIRVWNVATGVELWSLTNPEPFGISVAYSPDGRQIVWGSSLGTIRICDATTGKEIRALSGNDLFVDHVVFSRDGSRIASGGENGSQLWDATTGEPIHTVSERESVVRSMTFSPDGSRLLVCRESLDSFCLWNVLNGELIHEFQSHENAVTVATFSHDGLQVASGSRDKTARLWDTATGKLCGVLQGHNSEITALEFLSDDVRLVTASRDATLRIWNSQTGEAISTLTGHTDDVLCMAVSPDDTTLLSAGQDQTIHVWDIKAGTVRQRIPVVQKEVVQLVFSSDGSRFASVGSDHSLVVRDIVEGRELQSIQCDSERILVTAFSDDGRLLTTIDVNGNRHVWDVESGNALTLPDQGSVQWSWRTNPTADGLIALPDGINVHLRDLNHRSNSEQELALRTTFLAARPEWHAEEAVACEKAGHWYAACFHRAWLTKLKAPDGWFHDDLQRTWSRLKALPEMASLPLPAIVREMLATPRSTDLSQLTAQRALSFNNSIWQKISTSAGVNSSAVTEWDLRRMQDVCEKFPEANFQNTLGVLLYRMGRFPDAIASLNRSVERTQEAADSPTPSIWDSGFLALSHFRLGHTEKSNEFRDVFLTAAAAGDIVLRKDTQKLIEEVRSTLDPQWTYSEMAGPDEFSHDGTFENVLRHRWQFWPYENSASAFSLVSEGTHRGRTCLKSDNHSDSVMAYQTVSVDPNSKYRVTGWIRYQTSNTELPKATPAEPAGAKTEAKSPAAETNAGRVDEQQSAVVAGASIGLLNRPESSDTVSTASDWTHVTLEFTTTESETSVSIGCRSVGNESTISGTAWFDDLKLEKLE